MNDEYSIYDAKAKRSALVRQVREGRTFVITVHGEPVAELRPFDPARTAQTLDERIAELAASGQIVPAKLAPNDPRAFRPGDPAPGALKRFLDERD